MGATDRLNCSFAANGQTRLSRVRIGHPREDSLFIGGVFRLLFAIQILVNYDSGAVPVCLDILQDEFNLTPMKTGIIGCVPYLGITLAAAPSGFFLQKYSQKQLLLTSLVCNILCCACI